MPGTANAKLCEELGCLTLEKRRANTKVTLMYKLVNNLVPNSLQSVLHDTLQPESVTYNTLQRFDLPHFTARTDLFNKPFSHQQ